MEGPHDADHDGLGIASVEVRRLPYGGHAGHATHATHYLLPRPPLQLRPWIVVSSGSGPVDIGSQWMECILDSGARPLARLSDGIHH